jgi:hypothetical protein
MGHCAHGAGADWASAQKSDRIKMLSYTPSIRHRSRAQRTATSRRAYSMIEVLMAATICVSALVPALAMLRDGMALGDVIDTRHMLLNYSVSKMEEQLAVIGASWSTGTITGNFASDGQPSIRFMVTRSDDPADGGIVGKLMAVSVTTYSDDNNNGVMDSSEAHTTMTTKIAKLVSYATKAGS